MATIYQYDAKKTNGERESLKKYENKVVLIVNTASKCGFTPQFTELQELYEKYQNDGLTILGFPCDQFKEQEFDSNEEIMEFCQVNYGVTFPMYAKIDVKGENADPLFTFLTSEKKGLMNSAIKWNFTKFLVKRDGTVMKRFAPQTNPSKMEKDIQILLGE
ncbi:glutathione peroxidase [Bacillus sp. 2205SS5-2]|uniref:glutathione peroxidase n=1 Tax=Bacillus sp. 2205SS5-2 TaxID=3109031 RepID=UPI0030070B8D